MKPLRYVEMPAASPLSALVATYWGLSIRALPHPGFTHRIWPDGCATLAICTTRVMKYRFYDEKMHGRDWDAIKARYKPLLRYVAPTRMSTIWRTR